jgi:hypothetical protein
MLMWILIRIQLINVMRLQIRILPFSLMRFHADPDPDPQPARRYTVNALLLTIFSVLAIFCRRYLHKLFTQLSKHKGKLKVRHLPIEDVTASLPHHLEVSPGCDLIIY